MWWKNNEYVCGSVEHAGPENMLDQSAIRCKIPGNWNCDVVGGFGEAVAGSNRLFGVAEGPG